MKLGEFFTLFGDFLKLTLSWFGDGADKLWQQEILELTLGQSALTLVVIIAYFFVVKEQFKEFRSNDEKEMDWWNSIQELWALFLVVASPFFAIWFIQALYNHL
tara:strand:- start:287 stop:598 length:312 start_codon:yes stop_codon:yes gene_type:complete